MRLERPTTSHIPRLRHRWGGLLILLGVLIGVGIIRGNGLLVWGFTVLPAFALILFVAVALLVFPGLALLSWLWPNGLAPSERWALAIGVSSALPPLLLLVSEPIGVRWGSGLAWGYVGASFFVVLWSYRHLGWSKLRTPQNWLPSREHQLLLVISLVTLLVRLYVVRDLPVGLWGDSYQHTMMAQLLIEHGGLFSSWQPYVPLQTFTYHYGFHSLVAWLAWLTAYPAAQGVLLIGQLQSACAAPLLYVFTRRLTGSSRAGLWAALIAGVVSGVPAYYVNWGRYTQLAGQTILPVACVIWMLFLDTACQQPLRWNVFFRQLALTALITGGMALTHYRVAIFGACFVVAYALYLVITHITTPRAIAALGLHGLSAGFLTLLLIAPWLLRLRAGALLRLGGYFLSTNIGADTVNGLPPSSALFSLYANRVLIGLALMGILFLIWRRSWRGLVSIGWVALALLAANPYWVGLNGAGIITNFAVLIASYLVLSPLAGIAIDNLLAEAARLLRLAWFASKAQVLIGAAVLLWGLGQQQAIVDHQYQIFTSADNAAMGWIRRETPPNARFYVNCFPAYGGTLYAGSDGGWWLPLLANRQTNLPPLTQGTEVGEQPNYQQKITTLNRSIQQQALNTPEAAAALQAAGFSYLYDGPAAAPPNEYIDSALLSQSPLYEEVYHQDGVTIWKVR